MQRFCPVDGDWPQTIAGVVAYKTCGDDLFGYIRRQCSLDGTWGEVVADCCGEGIAF